VVTDFVVVRVDWSSYHAIVSLVEYDTTGTTTGWVHGVETAGETSWSYVYWDCRIGAVVGSTAVCSFPKWC
jgi:hypothetical protein